MLWKDNKYNGESILSYGNGKVINIDFNIFTYFYDIPKS